MDSSVAFQVFLNTFGVNYDDAPLSKTKIAALFKRPVVFFSRSIYKSLCCFTS